MSVRKSALVAMLATTALVLPVLVPSHARAADEQRRSVVYRDAAPVVVVTPLKSQANLDQVPFAVSVVNKDDIAQAQPQSMDDLLKNIPNFTSAGTSRAVVEEANLRGLSDRRIVIKVDGIRRNFRAQYAGRYFIDPYMVDHVEVVRGANSAIDGSGAMAGVIQFFTPTAKKQLVGAGRNWGTENKIGYQSANNEFSTMLSGYATGGKMDIYSSFSYRESDDVRAGGGEKIDDSGARPRNGLLKGGIDIADGHRLEVRYARFYDKSGIPGNPFHPITQRGNYSSVRKSGVTDYSVHHNFTPQNGLKNLVNLKSILYRSEYRISSTRLDNGQLDQTDFDTTGLDVFNTASLNYAGASHKLTTGIEYFENEQSGTRNGGPRTLLGSGRDANLGLYIQQETMIGDRLTIVPGIRFDHYRLRPEDKSNSSQNRNEWSPKLGIDYRVTNDLSVYGSVSRAFRTPTMTELYANGTLFCMGPFMCNNLVASPDLKPETGVNKEIGLRYKKAGVFDSYDHISFAASIFQNDIKDYIEQYMTMLTTEYRNVDEARLRGLEIAGRYRINNVAATINIGLIRGQNETLDQPLADVPQNKYALGLEYYALQNTLVAGARVTHNQHQDRIAPGQDPSISTTSGSTVFDFYASYVPDLPNNRAGSFRVDFGVDNLFDKRYRQQLSFLPETGRNVKVTASWKF